MYDIIIIGCGPAGMTAAIYAARAGKKVLILEKETIGGQMASAPLIENYPGYTSIPGNELSNHMFEQIMNLGVEIELERVTKIKNDTIKQVVTEDNIYKTRSIIIATGSKYRVLNLENETNLIGRGIHFCVSCDGAFYKNKEVAVIGGGNSAIINAITLSGICSKVYVIHHSKSLAAEDILITKLNHQKNIQVMLESEVIAVNGKIDLESITIQTPNGQHEIKLDGIFLSIGLDPQNDIAKDILPLDKKGYICSVDGTTPASGIFVAGDCRKKIARQVAIATSDGAIAALQAITFLNSN